MRYIDMMVTFSEVPDEISLCINISNCPFKCEGCHSSYLREDIGTLFLPDDLKKMAEQNKGITCICLMGGDRDPMQLNYYGKAIQTLGLKSAWYSGADELSKDTQLEYWDYIKLGHYDQKLGGLDKRTTNQRLYIVKDKQLIDITYKFWK